MELQEQEKALRARIETAFADVLYPGDDNLDDGTQRDDDYDDMIAQFQGRDWRDLIPKDASLSGEFNPLRHSMVFCSAVAWRYFLPAYLITGVMQRHVDTISFRPDRSEGLSAYVEERFGLLDAEQCAVVAAYLRYGEVLLGDEQKKYSSRSTYFDKQHARLAALIEHWDARSEYAAASEI